MSDIVKHISLRLRIAPVLSGSVYLPVLFKPDYATHSYCTPTCQLGEHLARRPQAVVCYSFMPINHCYTDAVLCCPVLCCTALLTLLLMETSAATHLTETSMPPSINQSMYVRRLTWSGIRLLPSCPVTQASCQTKRPVDKGAREECFTHFILHVIHTQS